MLKIVYLATGLIGLLIFIALIIFASANSGLNFGMGVLFGIYPYLSWQVICRFLPLGSPMSWVKKLVLTMICLVKIGVIGLILYFISLIPNFKPFTFISGIILPLPVILVTALVAFKINTDNAKIKA